MDLGLTAAGEVAAVKWCMSSLRTFLGVISAARADRVDLYDSKAQSDRFLAAAISPGPEMLTGALEYVSQTARVLTSTIGLVIGLIGTVGPQAGLALAVSALSVTAISWSASPWIRFATARRNSSHARMAARWGTGFDNLVIGNTMSQAIWRSMAAKTLARYCDATIRQTRVSVTVHSLVGVVAYVPILAFIAFADNDAALVLALLPKLLEACKGIMDCGSLLSSVGGVTATIKQLNTLTDQPSTVDLACRVRWADIRYSPSIDAPSLLDIPLAGRITIRGSNGTGKTTILSLLKETLGRQAIYIPAGARLQHRVGTICGSAGELQAEGLRAALMENPRCLLLDEWDAHLDDERATELSSQIDGYVKRGGVVVEIRHRRIQLPD